MTKICENIPNSFANPCEKDKFFDNAEDRNRLINFEKRELPPITNPAASCDFNLFFGFFFDGTRNNYNSCTRNEGYSNVARLYDTYPGQVVQGVISGDQSWQDYPHFFKVYVPGVGTPFDKVNDPGDSLFGAAAAAFGHERISWGLMQAINNIHRYFFGKALLSDARIAEISSQLVLTGWHLKRERYLSAREIENGQQSSYAVLRGVLKELHGALAAFMIGPNGRPANEDNGKVIRIHVSAFGFSRGATKARCFLNWLRKLCELDAQQLRVTHRHASLQEKLPCTA